MKIEITIPDAHTEGLGDYLGYEEKVDDLRTGDLITNPESLGEFLKRKGLEYYQNSYEAGRNKVDQKAKIDRLSDMQTEKAKITSNLTTDIS